MSDPSVPSRRYIKYIEDFKHLDGKRGWQSRLAERLDVTPSFVSKVSRGQAKHISEETIAKAIAKGIPRSYFYGESEGPHPLTPAQPPAMVLAEISGWRTAASMAAKVLDSAEIRAADDGTLRVEISEEEARELARFVAERLTHNVLARVILEGRHVPVTAIQLATLVRGLAAASERVDAATHATTDKWSGILGIRLATTWADAVSGALTEELERK